MARSALINRSADGEAADTAGGMIRGRCAAAVVATACIAFIRVDQTSGVAHPFQDSPWSISAARL
jgi:hypothetical protein